MITIVNKKYNDMLYDTKPVKFSDFISNKYNIVHKQIYENAINSYIKDWLYIKELLSEINILNSKNDLTEEERNKLSEYNSYVNIHGADKKYINGNIVYNVSNIDEFKEYSHIIEIPALEYWQPSKICIMTKFIDTSSPNLRWTVDLTPYWNKYQAKEKQKIENIKLSNENFVDSEIIKFNYLTGKATLYSENTNKEYDVDFDYLDGNNNKVSADMTLSSTFGYQINNK